MFEKEQRDIIWVPRWGIIRTLRTQSVAEHSYYVALYSQQIAQFLKVSHEEMGSLLRHALWHDMSEGFMSDIPGPVKRHIEGEDFIIFEARGMVERFGYTDSVGVKAEAIIKVADYFEEVNFLCEELRMGNSEVKDVLNQAISRFRRTVDKLKTWWPDNEVNTLYTLMQKSYIDASDRCSKVVPDTGG